MRDLFRRFARGASELLGRAEAFLLACAAIVLWAVLGPVYRYSDTWQLVINTATTIITFLMVFLIQKTQNRDAKAAPALSAHSRRGARHRPCLLGPEGQTTYRDNPRSLLDSPAIQVRGEHGRF